MWTRSRFGMAASSTTCAPNAAATAGSSAGRLKRFVPSVIRGSLNGPDWRRPARLQPSWWFITPPVTAFQPDLPYVVAHIAIDGTDGRVEIVSNVIGCPWQDVKVGMAVKAVFEDVTPEVTLAKFEPA